jgi:hypothetical protein
MIKCNISCGVLKANKFDSKTEFVCVKVLNAVNTWIQLLLCAYCQLNWRLNFVCHVTIG